MSAFYVLSLSAQTTRSWYKPANHGFPVIHNPAQTGFMDDCSNNKHQSADISISTLTLQPENAFPLFSGEYKGFGSDLYEVSNELVTEYYNKKILIYNFYNTGFLFISLKDAQNTNGLLQIRIPFGNMHRMFDKVKRMT